LQTIKFVVTKSKKDAKIFLAYLLFITATTAGTGYDSNEESDEDYGCFGNR
jgi:hypothetical protein